ncbi:hypothetical protein PybrP1_008173 [[Pythium] brassicae (nom. inval.)]|nr:hypothetical protein PybrP1_008173 [[Pythium] brassicae (nom. inval.)]
MTAAPADDGSHKPRGFMRAVGGIFHRRSARESESRHSTLDAPAPAPQEQSASAASSVAPRGRAPEDTRSGATTTTASASAASSSAASRGRDANNSTLSATKMRAAARHVVRNPFRKKSSESLDEVLASSSKDSDGTAPSDDDDDGEPAYATQFLFYSGSAEDNSFKPEKVHSTVVEIDYNAIRPSLTLQMPVFFSPPKEQSALRRSSILTDPREYEL